MLKKNKVISISSLFKIKFHIGENKEKWNPLIKNYVFLKHFTHNCDSKKDNFVFYKFQKSYFCK